MELKRQLIFDSIIILMVEMSLNKTENLNTPGKLFYLIIPSD